MAITPAYMTYSQIKVAIDNDAMSCAEFLAQKRKHVEEVIKHQGTDVNTTLEDYVFGSAVAQSIFNDRFELEPKFKALEPLCTLENFDNTPLAVLEKVNLYALNVQWRHVEPNQTGLWAALTDSATLCELRVRQLGAYGCALATIATRLVVLNSTKPQLLATYATRSKDFLSRFSNLFRPIDFPLGQLVHLTGAELSQIASKLYRQVFSLISDQQFHELDFSKLTGEQIQSAIQGDEVPATLNRRLQNLTAVQVQYVFLKNQYMAGKMAPELFQSCPLTQLSYEEIHGLFISSTNAKAQFQQLLPQQIMDAVSKIDLSFFVYLSPDQIRALDLSRMGSSKFHYIFDYLTDTEETKREKVQAIPLTQIHQNTRHFQGTQLRMLSAEQRQALNFSVLNSDQMRDIFSDEAGVANLDVNQLNRVISYVTPSMIAKLDMDKLPGIDLRKLDEYQLRELFPPCSVQTLYPGFTCSARDGLLVFERITPNSREFHAVSQKELDSKIVENKEICARKLSYVTEEQLTYLRTKLTQEVIELRASARV
jgi:hypothetical protein